MPDRVINETDTVVLLPAYEVLGVPHAILPTGLVPISALTAAAINHYAVVVASNHANAGGGGNVSCALLADNFTLGLTDSTEDDEKTLCDAGNSVDLTDFNFDEDLTGFRDESVTANGVFNLFRDLVFAPDVPYITVHRVGFASTVPFAVGQEIDAYYALTDNPVPVYGDGEKQKVQQTFVPKNTVEISYEITA